MITRGQQLAVVGNCLLAAMTNAGAVTGFALGLFVLPGVVIAAAIGSFLAARRLFGTALIVGGAVMLGWSELVNIWSGSADGPAARATFVASGCTLVALVVARSSSPALFLAAVAGSVGGALLLGAGGEVRIVVVATAVAAALTLGSIESSKRHWAEAPRRGPALVLLSLLVGAAAAGVVVLQARHDTRQPYAIGSGLAYPGIKPSWTDPLGTTKKAAAAPRQAARRHTSVPRVPPRPVAHARTTRAAAHASSHAAWLYIFAALLIVALAVLARLLAVRVAWLRLRRRLATGAIADQITGAWTWSRMRLEACRLPLPASVSPDIVAAGAPVGFPADVLTPMRSLAAQTTTAAFGFGQPLASADATAAWTAARQAEASARDLLTRRARVGLAFRAPAARTGGR